MHEDLQEIEIRELLSIKGSSGLWKIRKFMQKANMVNAINIVTEEIKTVPLSKIGAVQNYQVYTNDGTKQIPVEDVLNSIEELRTGETKECYNSTEFKNLPDKIKTEYMEKIAPDHSDAFKDYHVEKILKWAEELEKYFEIVNEDVEEL